MESQAASTSNTKKRAFRSEVWDHFKLVEGCDPEDPKSKCNYYGQVYGCHTRKIGTSNMTRHISVCRKYLAILDKKQKTLPFVKDEREGSGFTVSFMQETVRDYIARMLIIDELPMRIVEGEGFEKLLKYFQNSLAMPSRRIVGRDIEQVYIMEKPQLKEYFKKSRQRMCLTTYTWTSIQNYNYMVLTGYFADGDWKVHKRILNFCKTEDHKGDTIASMLEECLLQWGIEKVMTITVDNASSNDVVIGQLKKSVREWKCLVLDEECIHVRCFANILNLIVSDSLKDHQAPINRVRRAGKYIKSSPRRLQNFKNCIDSLKITFKGNVSHNVSTRWNSMYMILENAEKYSKAFEKLGESKRNFISDMGTDGPPTPDDWAEF